MRNPDTDGLKGLIYKNLQNATEGGMAFYMEFIRKHDKQVSTYT